MQAEAISQQYDRAEEWMRFMGCNESAIDLFLSSGGCNPLAEYYVHLYLLRQYLARHSSATTKSSTSSQDRPSFSSLPEGRSSFDATGPTCKHDSTALYSCRVCGLALADKYTMTRHIKDIHLVKYKCSKCNFAAETRQPVKSHLLQSISCDAGKRIQVEIDAPMRFNIGKTFSDRNQCAEYLTKHSNECLKETGIQTIRHLLRGQDILPVLLEAGEKLKMWDSKDTRKWRAFTWTEPVTTYAISRLTRGFGDHSEPEALNTFITDLLTKAKPSEKRYSGGAQTPTDSQSLDRDRPPNTPVELDRNEDLLPDVAQQENTASSSCEASRKSDERGSSSKRPLSVFSASQIPYRGGHPPVPCTQPGSHLPLTRVTTPINGLRGIQRPPRPGFQDSSAAHGLFASGASCTRGSEQPSPSMHQLRDRLEALASTKSTVDRANFCMSSSRLNLDISNDASPSSLAGGDFLFDNFDSPYTG